MALGISRKEGESFFLDTSDGVIEVRLTKFKYHAASDSIRAQIAIAAPSCVVIRRDDMISKVKPRKAQQVA